ncbi:unnamed protein product [Effrenium voratum]|nr:unnamed protein product [Effrenium voratum]
MAMTRLSDLRAFYRVAPEVWAAVVSTLGDPAEDLRPFAAVPPAALAMACETADVQGAAMTAIQASQVGLTYRLARRICHVRAGGSWGLWEDPNPWESALTPTGTSSGTPGTTRLEPKMKMTHVLDQADETEFMVEPEETRAKWVTQYVSLTGGLPPEEEEPSMEQLSALSRRVFSLKGAPYADFSVWVPYGKKALRTARFRSYVATLEGFVTKELAGPTNFEMWQASYRVYRTAMVMLNITPLAHLNAYETHIEKMVRFYPGCWHLIVQADDRARSEHLTRLKLRVTVGRSLGLDQPKHYSDDNPWQTLFRVLIDDDRYWSDQVYTPATAWWRLFITDHLRKGIKGAPYVFLILGMARRLLRRTAGGHEGGSEGDAPANEPGESSKGPRKRKAPPQGWEGDCPGRDSGSEGEKAHHVKVEEELKAHLKHRTFIFVHHFSGAKDVLGEAVMAEAKEQGVRVTVVSVDTHLEGGVGRAALDGDLSKDRPYLDHLKLAKDGCVDLYHVKPAATLENPPPSTCEGHLSAWELEEVKNFGATIQARTALFNTCVYEPHLPLGAKHFKPQQFVGTLPGLTFLSGTCACGAARHDPIVGKAKSSASAEYPSLLCQKYASLAVKHFTRIATEEMLERRMNKVKDNIAKMRKLQESQAEAQGAVAPQVEETDGTVIAAKVRPDMSKDQRTLPRIWRGSVGKYGMFKPPAKDLKVERLDHIGGMRDPAKDRRRLGSFRQFPESTEIAECYGTKGSSPNPKYVEKWKERLNQLVGTKPGPAVKLIPQGVYVTPANVPLIKAWSEKGGDPETEAQVWLEEGAPLGIEKEIKTCRIFPMSDEGPQEQGLPDAAAQLHRGDMTNYESVESNKGEAEIELRRYEEKGYMRRLSRQELLEKFPNGTISRLALILKVKENLEVKRRVVIDLRRSRGNAKARLPEKLVLPRPDDAVRMVREIRAAQETSGATRDPGWAMEFALIDISDAFMTLPVHEDELGHGLAPSTVEGAHQVYLDDSLWCFAGTLRRRNYLLAFVLTTMLALGLKIALGKGERANAVTWVGVRFALVDRDTLVLTLPVKFMEELLALLASWKGRGMAPVKELRTVAGKASWLAGVLPRAKWTVAIFYAVMCSVDEGIATGAEGARLLKVGGPPLAEITIATDASPEGIGAVIFINNVAISALAGPVGEQDAKMLRFELGSSSSQGILEALAVLVAIRTWADKSSDYGLVLRVQSDSTTALALSQRLAHSSPSLNFLGAELALTLEKLAIDRIVPCHIPGVANEAADFLSRPSKWKERSMPEHLHGVKVIPVAGRDESYFTLPPPGISKELWAIPSLREEREQGACT